MPLILAPKRLKQEDSKFETSLNYSETNNCKISTGFPGLGIQN